MKQKFLQRDFLSFFFVFLVLFFVFTLAFLLDNLSDPSVSSQEKFGWACTTFAAACTTTGVGFSLRDRRRRPE